MPTTPNYTLTGTILSLTGAADQGYALLELENFTGLPLVSGAAIIAKTLYQANCDNTGAFSVTLWGNDQLNQTNTYYTVTLVSNDGSRNNPVAYQLNGGGTHDLSTLTPVTVQASTPAFTPVVINPLAIQTILNYKLNVIAGLQVNGHDLNFTDLAGQVTSSMVNVSIVTKTANYSATATDDTILCNGTFTVTLPTNLATGKKLMIKNIGTGVVTASSAVNIDGATSLVLTSQYQSIDVQWNGTQWWIE